LVISRLPFSDYAKKIYIYIYVKLPLKYINTFLFNFKDQVKVAILKYEDLFSSLTACINPLAFFTAFACPVV